MLLFMSFLMGIGIIVPGYLKLREFELSEATEYALDRSIRMKNQVRQSVSILQNAGVSDIESYVAESKDKFIKDYKTSPKDPRVNQYILDDEGKILYESNGSLPMPITAELIDHLEYEKARSMPYAVGANKWLLTFQKHDAWGWHLLSSMSEQEVYQDSRDYLTYVMIITGIVILFVISLYILMTRQLRRKASIIMNHLEMYKAGRYDKRFQVSGSDELSILQNSINSMIDSIEIEIDSRKIAEKELINLSKKHDLAESNLSSDTNIKATNSINTILGFSDLLGRSRLTKKQTNYVNKISLASQNLNRLLNEGSGYSKLLPHGVSTVDNALDTTSLCDSLKNLEVLLVDDDTLNSEYTCEVLRQCKIKCITVNDHKQVIEYFNENDADLILLDIDKPGKEDEKIITYIRKELQSYLSNIPIITMTNNATKKETERYAALGATAAIAKPFSSSQVLSTISKIVDTQ